jgi:hypothetical protein
VNNLLVFPDANASVKAADVMTVEVITVSAIGMYDSTEPKWYNAQISTLLVVLNERVRPK